jgi:hypothetical protein
MTPDSSSDRERDSHAESLNDLLLRLDRATEVLEVMDELGVNTRDELQALMEELERLIDDAE